MVAKGLGRAWQWGPSLHTPLLLTCPATNGHQWLPQSMLTGRHWPHQTDICCPHLSRGNRGRRDREEPWAGGEPEALGRGLTDWAVPLLLPSRGARSPVVTPPGLLWVPNKGTSAQGTARTKCVVTQVAPAMSMLDKQPPSL